MNLERKKYETLKVRGSIPRGSVWLRIGYLVQDFGYYVRVFCEGKKRLICLFYGLNLWWRG